MPRKRTKSPVKTKAKRVKATAATKLGVGDELPDVEILNQDEEPVNVGELAADAHVVIFFYPRANTGGCTKQAKLFRDMSAEFKENNTVIFGMSADNPTPQRNWKAKHEFPFDLLCDKEHEVMKPLGIGSGKRIKRSHIVVARGGKLVDVSIGVKPGDSAPQALQVVKGL